MGNKINVNINGLPSLSFASGTPLSEIKDDYKKITGKTVVGARNRKSCCRFKHKVI